MLRKQFDKCLKHVCKDVYHGIYSWDKNRIVKQWVWIKQNVTSCNVNVYVPSKCICRNLIPDGKVGGGGAFGRGLGHEAGALMELASNQ